MVDRVSDCREFHRACLHTSSDRLGDWHSHLWYTWIEPSCEDLNTDLTSGFNTTIG